MMDFIIGTATLVPSIYWTAVVAAQIKSVTGKEDK